LDTNSEHLEGAGTCCPGEKGPSDSQARRQAVLEICASQELKRDRPVAKEERALGMCDGDENLEHLRQRGSGLGFTCTPRSDLPLKLVESTRME